MPRHLPFVLAGVVGLAISGCGVESDSSTRLPNSAGKDDGVALRLKLTDSNPVVSFIVSCDQPHGCDGHVGVAMKMPDGCALFPTETHCGVTKTNPLSREIATTTITSTTEGVRKLPLHVESPDGMTFTREQDAGFTAKADEDVEVVLEKTAGTPDMLVEIKAEWKATEDPGADINEVKAFLSTVPGLTVTEMATQFAGYRALMLDYEQPIDQDNPAMGTFHQRMVLHHKSKSAPTVLYTSGYALFENDDLSEPAQALGANQINTEQRWFGTSHPDITPASWQYVNIQEAAKDHHRIVQALRPFYSGKWLSTGWSKGGMTSMFHHRFFPQDVDATIAYVAPISFAMGDPRYVPWLDQIGTTECREAVRNVQKRALMQFSEILMRTQRDSMGQTFERTGGIESALEKGIIELEWGFWQYGGTPYCSYFTNAPADVDGLYNLLAQWGATAIPDSAFTDPSFQAYEYQASTQLGNQSFSTAHLDGLLHYTDKKINQAPDGTNPVHDPSAMVDMQDWVKTQASHVLFVYGGFDPWSGGAYDVPQLPEVVKVMAPGTPHGTYLKDLAPSDRDLASAKIEQWMGVKPTIASPMTTTPSPALPRVF